MTEQSHKRSVAAASQTVTLLDERAADLRAELTKLRMQLADVEGELSDSQTARLQEANQKLVLAVLQADRIAEVAVANLAELTESHQRDALTGLPNRALGLDRLAQAIVRARRNAKRLAVLFLDLDHFKAVNDSFGHAGGDHILQQATQRLQSVLRESDTLCRYGGDEFLVLLPDLAQASDAGHVAGELLAALSMPTHVGGHMLQQSASIGISVYPDDGEDAVSLIDCADAAMYRSKRSATGAFQFHAERDIDEVRDHALPSQFQPVPTVNGDVPADTASRQHDLREANEQLVMSSLEAQASEVQARNAHQQQMKFMAMVAHELRNPLTPLRLATEMLINPDARGEISNDRLSVIIGSQVTRMARLIDDLLDGSRLSTGKLHLELETVDLVAVVDQVATACRPGMRARQQHFSVNLVPGPRNVRGDPIRLAQIFSNVLDNACKYTPEGGEIALGMTVGKHSLSISVRDNGLGISAEMLPTIFDFFAQDGQTLSHSRGGLGIGLAVVRDLVEAHGGTVVGHSKGRDLGSEFVVTLPLP